ncbi:helix-turn-helix domain-containing protein [Rossellomorea vietnamensis]|uniref:Helix-turn-helix domain-containing protein n=1 Tax=Rossellomorea vietnamensis TaxID=218284 RepID=A0ACD4CB44_9BACI|nr:helix-turn-helix domain-containing protein [Rossellomorea vietnamensis]UXH45870.1 helix-turn-helix domain-containing protein [Rossellomorea vietnamensis]
MFTSLRKKYPGAIIQHHYPTSLESTKVWFTNEQEDEYIGIDQSEISQPELDLLYCLFQEITPSPGSVNDSHDSAEWYHYLLENGPVPSMHDGEFRIIQFSLKEGREQLQLREAFQHLLPHGTILIFLSDRMGLLIERKHEWMMDEEQLQSISHVIESDFFVSPSFYIGQFHDADSHFPAFFAHERELFSFSGTIHKQAFIQSAVTVLPEFTLHHFPHAWEEHFFKKVADFFSEDPEQIHTIRAFLENQSNISQTAKTLFMHRNSVQYRIDKFIERTNIDIKSFQGGILAYFACLSFQSDNLPNNV